MIKGEYYLMAHKSKLNKSEILDILVEHFEEVHSKLKNASSQEEINKFEQQYNCMIDLLNKLHITEE